MIETPSIRTIAVTGGAASGKSTVCRCLEGKGVPVISLDAVARDVVLPGMPAHGAIVRAFGPSVLTADKQLNRPVLREMITRAPRKKEMLEALVQPEILKVMNQRIRDCADRGHRVAVIEIPLLFELGMEKDFDLTVLVAVDEAVQIRRLMDRDRVSEDAARALIGIQMPLSEKKKRADVIIDNNGDRERLCRLTERFYQERF
ncbi:dephospho-CoA kinase [Desulfatiferula olefinivorans]